MCDGGGDVEPLERLIGSIETFVALHGGDVTPFELGERLIRVRHGIDLLELRFAREAAGFASTEEAIAQGSTSPIDWIRHQCRMSAQAAGRAVATGEEVERLPASVAALEEGRIGFAHLTLLAGTERAVQGSAGTFEEGPLLEQALEHSVSRFFHDCDHARHAADAAAVLAEHVNAVECRRLELSRCEDGRVVVRGLLDPVGGAALRVALGPLCGRSGAGDARPRPRRLADGLVELAMHSLDHGFTTEGGARALTCSSPPRWRP